MKVMPNSSGSHRIVIGHSCQSIIQDPDSKICLVIPISFANQLATDISVCQLDLLRWAFDESHPVHFELMSPAVLDSTAIRWGGDDQRETILGDYRIAKQCVQLKDVT